MMQNIYVQFDRITGEFRGCVTCTANQAAQQSGDGTLDLLLVPTPPLSFGDDGHSVINWDIIRSGVAEIIDQSADTFCAQFITTGSTQRVRYDFKAEEARAFQANSDTSVPILAGEAALKGISVADLAASVLAKVDEEKQVAALVEPKRTFAKEQLASLTNIRDMVALAQIDWTGPTVQGVEAEAVA
ncbi:MAG TPA: hypothetical protein VF503_20585 [Sphingobium sp.]|uniref:hypothetical protein n=1 Tax=Sphingobium sp. TaxID=1912891 RepID=UPI002ED23071